MSFEDGKGACGARTAYVGEKVLDEAVQEGKDEDGEEGVDAVQRRRRELRGSSCVFAFETVGMRLRALGRWADRGRRLERTLGGGRGGAVGGDGGPVAGAVQDEKVGDERPGQVGKGEARDGEGDDEADDRPRLQPAGGGVEPLDQVLELLRRRLRPDEAHQARGG